MKHSVAILMVLFMFGACAEAGPRVSFRIGWGYPYYPYYAQPYYPYYAPPIASAVVPAPAPVAPTPALYSYVPGYAPPPIGYYYQYDVLRAMYVLVPAGR